MTRPAVLSGSLQSCSVSRASSVASSAINKSSSKKRSPVKAQTAADISSLHSHPGENKIVFKVFGLELTSDVFHTGVMDGILVSL